MIYFVELEESEQGFFAETLADQDFMVVSGLDEVGPDAAALSTFIYSFVTDEFLAAHPKLKFITTRSTAIDHINLAACQTHGVAVANVPIYGETAVAEHTFALILSVTRRLREFMALAKTKEKFSYENARGIELAGRTLGLIGLGHIGQRVVELAEAFRMKVLIYSTEPGHSAEDLPVPHFVTMEELLTQSDVISLHSPLTSATYHILDRDAFARCKRGVIIVNTARGALIDTEALRDALDSGQVGGAGLDVLQDERVLRDSVAHIISEDIVKHLRSDAHAREAHDADRVRELQELMLGDAVVGRTNVIFTPHVAFNSVEAVARRNAVTVENLRAYLSGNPINLVTVPGPPT